MEILYRQHRKRQQITIIHFFTRKSRFIIVSNADDFLDEGALRHP